MNNDYSLFESFTKHGVWWLPSSPETRIRGNLLFDGDKIQLELFGVFQGAESLVVERNFEVIFGSCGREDVTLINCLYSGCDNSVTDSITSTWYCDFCLLGMHTEHGREHKFTRGEVRFSGLEEWIGDEPINDRFLPDPEDQLRTIRIEHRHEDIRQFNVKAIRAKLRFQAICEQQGTGYAVSLQHRAYIEIDPSSRRTLSWFIDVQNQFRRMLSLFADAKVQTITLRLFSKGPDSHLPPSGCLLWAATTPNRLSDGYSHPMLIRYPDIARRFAKMINIWYSNAERLQHVYNLYFAATQNQSTFADQDFLQLTQALEVFSRATGESRYVSDEDYRSLEEALLRAIPKDTDPDLRLSLKSRIRFGNEFSLRKRIKTILNEMEYQTVKLITNDIRRFVDEVVETRNYLVHLDETSTSNAIKDKKIIPMIDRLRLLLMVLLMKELRVPEEETRDILRRASVFARLQKATRL